MRDVRIKEIESRLGYAFSNKKLLKQAFVHSSLGHVENISDNERMEFFGDAVLEFLTSEYLYKKYPQCDAGELSKLRAGIVSADGLRPVVDKLDILRYLSAAEGVVESVKASKKIAANLYEAVLGAIFLDGGVSAARRFVLRTLKTSMDKIEVKVTDCKTLVQEYCQQRKWSVTYTRDSKTGQDNCPTFTCSLWIDGKKVSTGVGSSVKQAEQKAASKIVNEWGLV